MTASPRASADVGSVLGLDSGLEALRSEPDFDGPVEPPDQHYCNDHLAQIFETREEQLAAAVPYLRDGLERGERCMCVFEDVSPDEVIAALRDSDADLDVDEALDSGALTFESVAETYLAGGSFDADAMIDRYADAIATADGEYAGLRVVAETGWLRDESASVADFMEYEAKVNDLFAGTDCIALCQYDRDRFDPAVVRDVVRTHPHLIYRTTVCHNFYYTPPEEYLGPDRPGREVDRMLGTLLDRTEARAALERREEFLREQHDVVADPERSFEEKLQAVFELGRRHFGLEVGGVARVDRDADRFEVEYVSDEGSLIEPGTTLPLSETYCTAAVGNADVVGVVDPEGDGFGDLRARESFGIEAYLGAHVAVEGGTDRTFFFVSEEPREEPFPAEARTFHRMLAQWAEHEFERRRREADVRTLYETTAATDLSFEAKVDRLLALGCERFDLEGGLLTRFGEDELEIVASAGDGSGLEPGVSIPMERSYCRRALAGDGPGCLTNASEEGWASDPAYGDLGFESYLGVQVTAGTEVYGSLCFVDSSPRERPFTDGERTFLDLVGQCVSYELEREHREAQLRALNETSRDLMSVGGREAIADVAIGHAEETLRLPVAGIAGYDADEGALVPKATTERGDQALSLAALSDRRSGPLWEAFVESESRVIDAAAVEGVDEDLTGLLAVPMATHGVFVAGTTAPDGFGRAEIDFVEATAATVTEACVRADRERKLQDRERTLEDRNDRLQRLNRVNDIIRGIDGALVRAETRTQIDAVVCEHLAGSGPYELAWIGESDPATDGIAPREVVGGSTAVVQSVATSVGEGEAGVGPTERALRTGDPQVSSDVLSDHTFAEWRQAALTNGIQAAVALPLVHGDRTYGVLTVYAERPGAFGDLERSVLSELSDTIANAIDGVESKRALASDEVTELEFALPSDHPVAVLTDGDGRAIESQKIVATADAEVRGYFRTEGIESASIREAAGDLPVRSLDVVSERERDGTPVRLVEATMTADALAAAALERNGGLRSVEARDGDATATVWLHSPDDVRSFVEEIESRYPAADMLARRTVEGPHRTAGEVHADLTADLTDRQREAFQTAYFSGYFERPRPRTGSEIAAAMDITQPTFNAHLRTAQRKLCGRLFGEVPEPAADD